MKKGINIKYLLYKVCFSAVLCAFFFVQTQAEFIAHAYNDSGLNGQDTHIQKGHAAKFSNNVKSGTESSAKFKLNKRYQPVTSPAILPYTYQSETFSSPRVKEFVTGSPFISPSFPNSKPLRGPPSI